VAECLLHRFGAVFDVERNASNSRRPGLDPGVDDPAERVESLCLDSHPRRSAVAEHRTGHLLVLGVGVATLTETCPIQLDVERIDLVVGETERFNRLDHSACAVGELVGGSLGLLCVGYNSESHRSKVRLDVNLSGGSDGDGVGLSWLLLLSTCDRRTEQTSHC